MGSQQAGHTSADKWPPMPRGGYRRAVPRDVLTGEPIRPDTIHIRVSREPGDKRVQARVQARTWTRTRGTCGTRPTTEQPHASLPLPVIQLEPLEPLDRQAQP